MVVSLKDRIMTFEFNSKTFELENTITIVKKWENCFYDFRFALTLENM